STSTKVLLCAAVSISIFFAHKYFAKHQESNNRSSRSVAVVRKSLFILFAQLVVPLSMIVLPAAVLFLGLAKPELIAFGKVMMEHRVTTSTICNTTWCR
ncbi:hypothetical protein PENTCL1PPCAC_20276, partial [Pristionchus entomophagus]